MPVLVLAVTMASCVGDPPPQPPPPPPAAEPAVTPPPPPATPTGLVLDGAASYTVARGDTLSEIAEKRYGQSNILYFPLIRLANAAAVSDPDVIEPNIVLVIPNLQANLNNAGAKASLKQEMISAAGHYDRHDRPAYAAQLRDLANRL